LIVTQTRYAIARIDRARDFVTEIQQRVRERLLVGAADGRPRILDYAGRGSLAAFVRIAALRLALMEKRCQGRQKLESEVPDAIAIGDVRLEVIRNGHREEFQQALRQALAVLERNERVALRMSYIDHLSIDQIAKVFNIHRATAARWVTRALSQVRVHTLQHMKQKLGLSDSQADSLIGDLMSQAALAHSMLASTVASPARRAG
jgi:RNA polymerase sigma-70 factor, ECF subfamily